MSKELDDFYKVCGQLDEWLQLLVERSVNENFAMQFFDFMGTSLVRVTVRDGQSLLCGNAIEPIPYRINLEVENGIVVRAYRG